MNGYDLSRAWFNYSFSNPEKIKPIHSAIFFFAVEHCNRLGWKCKFGFPTTMVMEAIGVKSYNSYKKHFDDIVLFGFFKVFEYSKNQYSANIIALSLNDKALDKALDKAFIKHATKQEESTQQSIDSIDKPITSKQETNKHPAKAGIDKINFKVLLDYINTTLNKNFRVINKATKDKYNARLKDGYTKKCISNTILNCSKAQYHIDSGYTYLTPEFFSRSTIIDKYSQGKVGDIDDGKTIKERTAHLTNNLNRTI